MKRVVSLGLILFFLVGTSSWQVAEAYNEESHRKIVKDAFIYIMSTTKPAVYADKSTTQTDLDLMKKVLASGLNAAATMKNLNAAAERLADSSVKTDSKEDVFLRSCAPLTSWPCRTNAGEEKMKVYYTAFSHFLNVHAGTDTIWEKRGYYYGYVHQNKYCESVGGDRYVNIFIGLQTVTFDRVKSDAYLAYRSPRRLDITDDLLKNHFDQEIAHIHFWPITNMAEYWYGKFKSNASLKLALPDLGPVLHAAADTTVPFHAVGLSGCGHVEYEKGVDAVYLHRQANLYDEKMIMRFLVEKPWLRKDLSVEAILWGNALHSADKCIKEANSSTCPFIKNVAEVQIAQKELVNLAIASTVVMIRKAFSEWTGGKIETLVSFSAEDNKPSEQFSEYPDRSWERTPRVRASSRSIEQKLQPTVNLAFQNMNQSIVNLQSNKITKTQFEADFFTAIATAASTVQGKPACEFEPNEDTVAGPPSYREPTQEETSNQSKWEHYLRKSRAFYDAIALQNLGYELTIAESKIQPSATELEKISNNRSAKTMRIAIGEILDRTP